MAADVAAASADHPVTLPVDAEAAAGDTTSRTLSSGRVIKIMTGALLPAGADAVVPVEWTDHGTVSVWIDRPAPAGNYVRLAGEEPLTLRAGTEGAEVLVWETHATVA